MVVGADIESRCETEALRETDAEGVSSLILVRGGGRVGKSDIMRKEQKQVGTLGRGILCFCIL